MTFEQWCRYIGCVVNVVYRSRNGNMTKRTIRAILVRDGQRKAFCISSGAPRIFLIDNRLAVELVQQNVS